MKKTIYNTILTLFLCGMIANVNAQQHNNELFVGGLMYVEQGAAIYAWGDVHIDGADAKLINDGIVELEGNFHRTSDATYTDIGLGELIFRNDHVNTSEMQFINGDMTGQNAIANLTIDNGSAGSIFSLMGNVEVNKNFTLLSQSTIRTDNVSHGADGEAYRYELYISDPNPNALNLNGRFIEGRLRREVDLGNTYTFPIGTEDVQIGQAEAFEMTFNIIPTNFNVLSYFKDMPSDYNEQGVACNGAYLEKVCELGRWVTEPSNNVGTYSYDIRLMPGNDFFNACNATEYRLLAENIPVGDCSPTDYTANNLGEMSYFELVGLGVALDIELERFWASPEDDAIQLNWTTASETNNAGFDLERSTDGRNFEKIAWITGQINSSITTNYDYEDVNVVRDVVYYYRLKATETGGAYEYSPVVSAALGGLEDMDANVFPNPIKAGELLSFMSVSDGTLNMQVFDESSKLVLRKGFETLKGEIINTDLSRNLSGGIYTIILTDDVYTRRSMFVFSP